MTGPHIRPTEVNPNFSTPLTSYNDGEAQPRTSYERSTRLMESTNGQHSIDVEGNRVIILLKA